MDEQRINYLIQRALANALRSMWVGAIERGDDTIRTVDVERAADRLEGRIT